MRHPRKGVAPPPSAQPRSIILEFISLILFAVGVFTITALATYNPADPSLFSNSQHQASNACGWVGAYVSALFLQSLGFGAFLVPAALIFIGVTLIKREGLIRVFSTLGGMSVTVMAFAVFLTLQWKYMPYQGSLLLTGGVFGAWLAELLVEPFNHVGATIISLAIFALALAMSTPVSVSNFFVRTFYHVTHLTWKTTKMVTSFLFYFGSLVISRLAAASAELLQKFIELSIDQAKERWKGLLEFRMKMAEKQKEKLEVLEPTRETEIELGNGYTGVKPAGAAITSTMEPALVATLPPAPPSEGPSILPPKRPPVTAEKTPTRRKFGSWKLPTIEFLKRPPKIDLQVDRERLIENSKILKQKLADFGIDGEVTAVRPGPVITLYEFKPGPGIKVSRIAALGDDLSMALSAESVRILAPLPGKAVVGIEIPSEKRETVYLRQFLTSKVFQETKNEIPLAMGQDIAGDPKLSDLARMPHLLSAGQTGSGKSVFMNGLICSLLYRFTPDELRLILVDPKFIEFRSYQDIPHLLLPIVDDPSQAAISLKWAVREMERRYRVLAMVGARNLASYNQKVEDMGADVIRDLLFAEENQGAAHQKASPGSDWIDAFESDESGAPRVDKLPYIVIVIDELADLMMVARKEVEISIARIAQKARAAGIHLIVATQRPSTDVITGLIKANLPSRVSFQLASHVDSKTILDRAGAERLLGQGDMLFIPPGSSQIIRLHGAFVEDDEINKITKFLRGQGKPHFRDEILIDEEDDTDIEDSDIDTLFDEALVLVKQSGHASASFLQRHLKVGYNRAARMIETMEARGVVGPADGSRPREVLMR